MQGVINSCISYILMSRKQGNQEGFLNSINKGDIPLTTLHAEFLGPLSRTANVCKHIFAIIEAFSKFCWLFPTKSTTALEIVDKMNVHKATFENPKRIITNRGCAFTSDDFKIYCAMNNMCR